MRYKACVSYVTFCLSCLPFSPFPFSFSFTAGPPRLLLQEDPPAQRIPTPSPPGLGTPCPLQRPREEEEEEGEGGSFAHFGEDFSQLGGDFGEEELEMWQEFWPRTGE